MSVINGDANDNTLAGTADDDQISGLGGNDILQGSYGLDTLDGGDGFDWADYSTYTLLPGQNGLIFNKSAATVNVALSIPFNEAKDTITDIEGFRGTSGKDVMIGSGGADYFEGGAGNDIFDGNGGNDIIAYTHSSAGVNVNLATNVLSGGDAQGDQISGAWSYAGASGTGEGAYGVWGSAFADTLTGSAGDNELKGGDGDDLLTGGGGNDIIDGGAGNDVVFYNLDISNYTLSYSSGVITVTANTGSEGTDTLTGVDYIAFGDVIYDVSAWTGGAAPLPAAAFGTPTSGNDLLNGGSGSDTISAGDGNDTVYAGAGADTVNGGNGDDVIYGAGGDDILQGSYGLDVLNGGAGFDWADYSGYTLMPGQQGLILNRSTSTVNTALWIPFNEVKDTISGIEGFRGTSGKDVMIGSGGADYFEGGAGNDIFDGNGGNDIIAYTHSSAGVNVNLATNVLSGGDAQGDQISGAWSYAGASGTGEGAYGVWGSAFADTLTGNASANELKGDGGNDLLTGGGGADILDGGDGTDTASYAGSATGVTVSLATNTGTGGDAQGDTLIDIENLTGSDNADTLTGNAGANVLNGGADNDTLTGGGGADSLKGGDGVDTASYAGSAAAVNVNLATNTGTGGDAQGDTLEDIENLIGSAGNDTLIGNAGDNRLEGGNGNDTLNGGAGADAIIGGAGANDTASYAQSSAGVTVSLITNTGSGGDAQGDTLDGIENLFGSAFDDTLTGDGNANAFTGGAGADTIDGGTNIDTMQYATSAAAVTVNLTTNVNTGGDAQGDMLSSIENLIGSIFDDSLTGDGANNSLNGGNGNDTLNGGAGNDTLTGGAGTDTAVYALAGSNYSLSYNGTAVTVSATSSTDGTDTLTGIEQLQFSDGTMTIAGNGTGLSITGDAENNTINGTAGTDILLGGDGNDTINGMGGDDVIDGGNGNDTINGGAGADVIVGSAGSDNINGGSEIDILDYSALPITSPWNGLFIAMHVSDVRYYAAGQMQIKDTVVGVEHFIATAGNDWMYGSGGDEIFEGGAGADVFDGRGGNDTLSYVHSSAGVSVNLATGAASGGDAQGDRFLGYYANPVDNSSQAAGGAANLWGSAFADTLTGNNAANVLRGNDGNDILEGGGGNDTLEGGIGTDTAHFTDFIDAYTISYNNGVITVAANSGADGIDTLTGIEKLVFSGVTYDFTGWTGGTLPQPTGNILGTEADDNLVDTSGDDVILAYGGNDVIHVSSGKDVIVGGGGTDRLDYGDYTVGSGWGGLRFNSQRNTIDTYQDNLGWVVKDRFSGIEVLTGTSQNDWFVGLNSTTDIWEGGAGADVFDGNGGGDTLSYEHSSAAVKVNLTTGSAMGGDAQGDIIGGNYAVPGAGGTQNIAQAMTHLWGSAHADTLIGDWQSQLLRGNAGNDTLRGYGGNDTLEGGDGTDMAIYALNISNYTIGYSNGAITVTANTGSEGADILTGVEKLMFNDIVYDFTGWTGGALPTQGLIIGTEGNDTLVGTSGNDGIYSIGGDDTITGGAGDDAIGGGSGQDKAVYGLAIGNYTITYDNGAIIVTANSSNEGTDTLTGIEKLVFNGVSYDFTGWAGGALPPADNNVIMGTVGNDTMNGTAGNDIINALTGDDYIYALGGDDRILSSGDYDYVDGGDGFDWLDYSNYAYATTYRGVAINMSERTVYRFDYPDPNKVWASQFNNIEAARGSAYDDVITGDANDNILEGGAGADTLNGSLGNDTASYEQSGAAVTINLGTGLASGGHATGDTFTNIENLSGSAYADTLTGNAGSNILEGRAGGDTLDGGSGFDFASYALSAAGVSVNLLTSTLSGGDAAGDSLASIEGLIGSAYADTLTGNAEANELRGGDGADILNGGDGNDVLAGGTGADTLNGGNGIDTADYSASLAGVSVNLLAGTASGGDAQGDTLSGIENLVGSAYADTLTGDAGDNLLRGGAGADTLNGGDGIDTVSYAGSSVAVTVNLATGLGTTGDAQGDTLSGIENFIGSSLDDTIYGSSGSNTLYSSYGTDIFYAGDGFDWVDYSNYEFATTNRGVVINLSERYIQRLDWWDPNELYGAQIFDVEAARGSIYDDTIIGDAGANILEGGRGNDTLTGSYGSDTYLINRGDGIDSIVQAGIGDAASTTDVVKFTSGVAYNQLWFSQSGNDLKIDVIGETASSVLLKDWYSDASRRVDSIQTADGSHSLSSANVQALVDAMASYSPPGSGQFTLDTQVANDLAPVFATTWA